ncbi:hypothetical protein OC842_007812, partial [Tilletia horrida]
YLHSHHEDFDVLRHLCSRCRCHPGRFYHQCTRGDAPRRAPVCDGARPAPLPFHRLCRSRQWIQRGWANSTYPRARHICCRSRPRLQR